MNKCFLIILFSYSVISSKAQQANEIRVDEVFHRIPLAKALKTIQSKHHVKIAYDNALVRNIIVDIILPDVSLSECFERLLQQTPLAFSKVGNDIIIIPKATSYGNAATRFDVKIAGIIKDGNTGETLPNAVIRIKGTNLITTSNNDGYFTLLHIPADTCFVNISCMGYLTQSINLLHIDHQENLTVKLIDDRTILSEVIVTDEFNQAVQIDNTAGKFAFNPKSLSSLPSLGEQDIFRTMQLMPGVCATDESSAGMSIRGMQPGYNLVLLDGMTIYQQDHFFGAFSIINSDVVKDVRVQKGVFDARYGGRVSGVIDITTKNGSTQKPFFDVKANFISLKGTAELPLSKKLSFFVAARRSFTDFLRSDLYKNIFRVARPMNDQIEIFPLDFFGIIPSQRETPSFYFYDINAKLTFKPSDRDVISLSFYNGRDRLLTRDSLIDNIIHISGHDREHNTWGNDGLSLRWARQWNDKFYSNARISSSQFFRQFNYARSLTTDSTENLYRLKMKTSIGDLTFALENEWLLSDRFSFDIGASVVGQNTKTYARDFIINFPDDTNPESIDISKSRSTLLASAYATCHASLTGKLSLALGTRINYYYYSIVEKQVYNEPRCMLQYQVNKKFHLKAAYGRSNQFVNQLIYYGYNGSVSFSGTWILSLTDYDLPVTSMDQFTMGGTFKRKNIIIDGEGYLKSSKGVVIDTDINSGQNTIYGFDLMFQKTTGIHKGWISYSLSKALQSNPYSNDRKYFMSLLDQRHELKVVNMLMLGDWNFSSTVIYGSGKPYPTYKIVYQKDSDGFITGYDLTFDYMQQRRVPSYFRFDLAASYKLEIKRAFACEAGLSIFNVSNHQNIKTKKVNIDALNEAVTEIPVVYADVKLLGFTPCVFLNISF